jgi:hypothetical protein
MPSAGDSVRGDGKGNPFPGDCGEIIGRIVPFEGSSPRFCSWAKIKDRSESKPHGLAGTYMTMMPENCSFPWGGDIAFESPLELE